MPVLVVPWFCYTVTDVLYVQVAIGMYACADPGEPSMSGDVTPAILSMLIPVYLSKTQN